MKNKKLIVIGSIVLILLLGIFGSYFARKGEPVDASQIKWLKSSLIANGGIHNGGQNIQENTATSFKKAIEGGNIIKLDVSETKDKKLVVFHDKKLMRMMGKNEYLKDLTYEQISKYKLISSNDENVPLFEDTLKLISGKVPVLIEINNDGEVGEIESSTYNLLKNYSGKYAIISDNPYSLKWFKDNAPNVLRGQISGGFKVTAYDINYSGVTNMPWYKKFALSNMLLDFQSKPNFIVYEIDNNNFLNLWGLRSLGVPLLGWTIDDAEDYNKSKGKYDNYFVNDMEAIGKPLAVTE